MPPDGKRPPEEKGSPPKPVRLVDGAGTPGEVKGEEDSNVAVLGLPGIEKEREVIGSTPDRDSWSSEKPSPSGDIRNFIFLTRKGPGGDVSDVLGSKGAAAGKRLLVEPGMSRRRTHVILPAEDVRVEEKDPVARQIVPEQYRESVKAMLEGGR